MNIVHRAALALAAAAPLWAALPAQAADDILATADKAGTFKTLISAAKAAGLGDTLTGKGPLTVLAPTDDAFKKLPAGTLEALLKPENKAQLAALLKSHVLPGKYSGERLNKAKARQYTVKTAGGANVLFDKKDGLTVSGAKVTKADISASNGTIHVIDAVIVPASVKKALAAAAPAAAATKPAPAAPAAKPAAAAPDAKPAEPAKGGQPTAPAAAKPAEAPKADAAKTDAGKADAAKPAVPAVPATPAAPAAPKK